MNNIEKLRWLEHASPITDVNNAVLNHGYCFKQIKGLENDFPGTEAADRELISANRVCVIAEVAANETDSEYLQLIDMATRYADSYTSVLAEVLRD